MSGTFRVGELIHPSDGQSMLGAPPGPDEDVLHDFLSQLVARLRRSQPEGSIMVSHTRGGEESAVVDVTVEMDVIDLRARLGQAGYPSARRAFGK